MCDEIVLVIALRSSCALGAGLVPRVVPSSWQQQHRQGPLLPVGDNRLGAIRAGGLLCPGDGGGEHESDARVIDTVRTVDIVSSWS